jgi:hypothetical protein
MEFSRYATRDFRAEEGLATTVWLLATLQMDDEEFYDELRQALDFAQRHRPGKWLTDMRDFQFPINPTTQQWMAEVFHPSMVAAGVRRFAFVLPQELIAQLSFEQVVDEVHEAHGTGQPGQFPMRYFTSPEAALGWLQAG